MANNTNGISFSWDMHYACNYRCPYCWFHSRWQELAKQNKYYSVSELVKLWTNIYKKYGSVHIELVGGEPFIYPNFIELVKQLSNIHGIGITSNLSVNLEKFIKEFNASNVNIAGTFHPLFANFDNFVRNMSILKENGINNTAWYLAYPPQIKLIQYYKDKFQKYEITLSVMTFWGEYNGIKYPYGYTAQEKAIIMPYLGDRGGEKFQLEPRVVKGKLCRAGQVYANIKADGLVYRCGGSLSQLIGNFFCDDFRLLDKPSPCESEFCPCNEWLALMVETTKPERTEIKKEINRSSIPPNRVFLTWDIHYACNYNCTYCNTPKPQDSPDKWDKDRDKVAYPGLEKWIKIWEEIYRKYGSCEIHITGGEPFTYPSFMELLTRLSQIHTLEIITNLSYDVKDIIKRVTPDRLRIGTTFHPEFAELKEFLNKHIFLRKYGFETWANYVAYPPQMEKMADYKKEFDKLGISFNIQPFMGHFHGREYPKGYTDSELSYLKGCYANDDIINKKTVEWKTGSEQKNTKSKLCRMGQMYAKIYPLGDAYRCCASGSKKLGNLIYGSFELLEETLSCDSDLCYCWRCMLVEEEKSWSQHWIIPEKKNYDNVNV